MAVAVFGTAHLFGLTPPDRSEALLDAAWTAGFRAFDTAPLYGHGRSEAEVGRRLTAWSGPVRVTSKVGLEPEAVASPAVRTVKAVARRLPAAVQRRLRPGGDDGPRGNFDPALVRASLDRTLRRLGRVDRLLLHEARAGDVTDEVLALLAAAVAAGDVGQIGTATVNSETAAVLARAPELLTVAHVAVGPFADEVDLPAGVTVVGHGALGPGAAALHRLSDRLGAGAGGPGERGTADATATARWRAVTAATRWDGADGLAAALVARAASLPIADLIVASSRVARLGGLHELASGTVALPDEVAVALAGLVTAAAGPSGG